MSEARVAAADGLRRSASARPRPRGHSGLRPHTAHGIPTPVEVDEGWTLRSTSSDRSASLPVARATAQARREARRDRSGRRRIRGPDPQAPLESPPSRRPRDLPRHQSEDAPALQLGSRQMPCSTQLHGNGLSGPLTEGPRTAKRVMWCRPWSARV